MIEEKSISHINLTLEELEKIIAQNNAIEIKEKWKVFSELLELVKKINPEKRTYFYQRINLCKKEARKIIEAQKITQASTTKTYDFPNLVKSDVKYNSLMSALWLDVFEALHIVGFDIENNRQSINIDDSRTFKCTLQSVEISIAKIKGIIDFVVSRISFPLIKLYAMAYSFNNCYYIDCRYDVISISVEMIDYSCACFTFSLEDEYV